MIKAVELTKSFGNFTALDGLCTEIERGCVYGLVGPNGSGKSTFLRLVCGVYMPDGGKIEIEGQPVYENAKIKDRIFYLPDDLYFPPKSTTAELADFYSGIYSSFSREKYNYMRSIFPIDDKKKLNTFSKGMRRQAAIMLALSCCTDYLLLDEAFDGLDPVLRLMVKKLIAQDISQNGLTVIITSHNLRELEDVCDHIGLLHKGQILFDRELDNLKFGFCKVQAAFDSPVDINALGLTVMKSEQKGKLMSLLVRGSTDETLETLYRLSPLYCEAVPLTLEEIFIGEMEAVGYDYNILI